MKRALAVGVIALVCAAPAQANVHDPLRNSSTSCVVDFYTARCYTLNSGYGVGIYQFKKGKGFVAVRPSVNLADKVKLPAKYPANRVTTNFKCLMTKAMVTCQTKNGKLRFMVNKLSIFTWKNGKIQTRMFL